MAQKQEELDNLPPVASEYIEAIIKKMRYRPKVRQEVKAELAGHFADALKDCQTDEERQAKAQKLINEFGDAKLLALLIRRGKKRCRPLWVQGLVKICQAAILLIILFSLYTVWFISGKPNPRIDYLAVLNEMGRSAVSEKDNAWPMYEKAGALYVQPDEMRKKLDDSYWEMLRKTNVATNVQKATMAEWVEENKAAWDQLVAGSFKRQFFREIEYTGDEEKKELRNVAFPAEPFNDLQKMARWHIWMNLEQGRPLQAAQDCLVMVRVARSLQGEHNYLVDHMIAVLYSRIAYVALRDIVDMGKLTITELKQVQEELAKIYKDGYPYLSIDEHRLCFLDSYQHGFTEGGPGGGHMTLNDLTDFLKFEFGMRERKTPWYMPVVVLGAGMIHVGRDETVAKTNELWNHIRADTKKSPYEREIKGSSCIKEFLSALPKYRYFLVHSTPVFWGRTDSVYRAKAEYEATMTIFALQRWQLEKGEYPENLEELIEECYLKQEPMDPFSDRPLVYKRTNDGFTLYSVGYDFADDGGAGSSSTWGDEDNEGDAVFWPVGEN